MQSIAVYFPPSWHVCSCRSLDSLRRPLQCDEQYKCSKQRQSHHPHQPEAAAAAPAPPAGPALDVCPYVLHVFMTSCPCPSLPRAQGRSGLAVRIAPFTTMLPYPCYACYTYPDVKEEIGPTGSDFFFYVWINECLWARPVFQGDSL